MKKQIPFRYEEDLDQDLEEIMKIQNWSPSKNKAISHAVIIAAAYLKKNKKKFNEQDEGGFSSIETKINADLKKYLSKQIRAW
jgi:CHASE3 domain sensor protein